MISHVFNATALSLQNKVQKEDSSGSATQISSSQNKVQEEIKDQDSEASPGPATQAYREEILSEQNKIQKVIKDGDIEIKQSDIQPDLIKKKYLKANKNALEDKV
ncbi:hypothetical protein F8M41_010517 [Gigaspora margarita]|uniref:Uncharacterized protein n=1 Tax=Gigaspora margarita TaxID=4874 RepID=A0A8H3X1H2_GIGMA|nr:hypothetical protein F8M41_010517 [Gigaspora margarita]